MMKIPGAGNFAMRSNVRMTRRGMLIGVIGVMCATPQCAWWDLDEYSSAFGAATTAVGSGGAGGSSGTGGSGGCLCGGGEECVNGVCETCIPMWTYDHKGLRQGDQRGIDHLYDPVKRTLLVASARQDGQDPSRAYWAELNHCRGTLVREFDGPIVEGKLVPGLQVVRRNGDLIFAKLRQDDINVNLGGYAVYDMASNVFTQLVQVNRFKPDSKSEGLWALDVTSSGKLWLFGTWVDMAGVTTPMAMFSDASGATCFSDFPNLAPSDGRAIATNNKDVYLTSPRGVAPTQVQVLHFQESSCDVAACNCPVLDELPPLALPSWSSVMAAKVAGSTLVVAGFYGKSDTDWVGFVAQYNFVTKLWGTPYFYDPTTAWDGYTVLAGDASSLYALSFKDYAVNPTAASSIDVHVFSFPISANSQPKTISVPNVASAYALTVDSGGMFVTGYDPMNMANGRSLRCTLDACP